MMIFFCGEGGGLVVGGGALLVGGGCVCDDLGGVSTGDVVMLTLLPELAHSVGGGGTMGNLSVILCLPFV